MADIRIKDLTTTASSTASDDFIAVDGATNGTRKLSAYSPTFGGNATVAGKVAINGGDTSASQLAVAAPNNTLAANFASSTTSGQSFGIRIFAGTNSSDYAVKIRNAGDTLSLLDIDGAGKVSISATTASTSTSTGALVVSGGVGVAGALYVGGTATFGGSNAFQFGTNILQSLASGGNGALIRSTISTASNPTYSNTDDTNTGVYFPSADAIAVSTGGTTALTLTSAQKAEFAATIKTAAPSGGTAAEWKLGTVASVSPTSPNRTIEVDIGGTIYYIHAKTTNN